MAKDLTTSQVDRQNILNNDLAISEIQKSAKIDCVCFEEKFFLTKEMVADFFEVDVRTIERYISSFSDELKKNGSERKKTKRVFKIFK